MLAAAGARKLPPPQALWCLVFVGFGRVGFAWTYRRPYIAVRLTAVRN
jgi:hypothetical protein